MAQRNTGRVFGALALLAVFLPLSTAVGCNLLNKEKKQFGEDCAADDDCDSLECGTYGSMCTKGCTYDRDCGAGYVCRARDGRPGDVCAKPTGVPTGQACSNAPECQSGNCLKPVGDSNATGFCSTHCDTDADCPDSHKTCASISDSGALKFCLPGSAGSAAIPGEPEPPKFIAPRPAVTTTKTPTTTSTTTTTTTTESPTVPGGNFLRPTATASASAAPTTTSAPATTAAPTATAPATATTSKTRPRIILKPK